MDQPERPDTQLQEVEFLETANVDLGVVYADIDSAVNPIQFGNILSEADRAGEAFRCVCVCGDISREYYNICGHWGKWEMGS